MERKSWYSRLFGGLFRGRSAAPEKKSGAPTLLEVLKAQRAARQAAGEYRRANPYNLPSTVHPVADTPINGTDETLYDTPRTSPTESAYRRWLDEGNSGGESAYRRWLDEGNSGEPEWESNFGSSNVEAYRYWDASGKLEVKFLDGSHYEYEGVGRDVFRQLREAGSKGTFIKSRIEQVYWYHEVTPTVRRYRKYPEEYLGPLNTTRGWGGYRRR